MQHEVHEYQLTGGARLLSIRIPNTITFYWSSTFRAGYRYVKPELYELPHLAEHLAFEGTRLYPDSLAFKVEVERDGTYYNAATGYNHVSYMYSGSKSEIGRIIPINLSQIYEPLYREEQIRQEADVILQEMSRKKEDDNWRLGYLTQHNIIPVRNPDIDERIGRIQTISQPDLLAYHKDCYGVANTVFMLAGDYSKREVRKIVAQLDASLRAYPQGKLKRPHRQEFSDYGGKVWTFEPYRQNQSAYQLQFTLPGRDDGCYVALKIISMLLTGGLSARLLRVARERGLTYSVAAETSISQDYTVLSIRSQTSRDKLQELVELTVRELTAIGSGDYTDDDLARAIGYYVGNLRRGHQTPSAYAGWYADRFLEGDPLESPEERVRRAEAIDRAAINRAYKKYMKLNRVSMTLIGTKLDQEDRYYRHLLRDNFA